MGRRLIGGGEAGGGGDALPGRAQPGGTPIPQVILAFIILARLRQQLDLRPVVHQRIEMRIGNGDEGLRFWPGRARAKSRCGRREDERT